MSLDGLAAACRRWPDRVVSAALPAIGQTVRNEVLEAARRDTGGDLRLSRMRAGKVAISFDVARPDLIVVPEGLGAWALLERGSRKPAWWIPRNHRAGRGRHRIRVGSGVRWYVRHGPVRGKGTWSRARTQAAAAIPAVVDQVATEELGGLADG